MFTFAAILALLWSDLPARLAELDAPAYRTRELASAALYDRHTLPTVAILSLKSDLSLEAHYRLAEVLAWKAMDAEDAVDEWWCWADGLLSWGPNYDGETPG